MRYLFLGISLSSALTAAGLATVPSTHREQRVNIERPAATQTHTPVRAESGSGWFPVVNLPHVGNSSTENTKDDCWDRLNQLLFALDSRCS